MTLGPFVDRRVRPLALVAFAAPVVGVPRAVRGLLPANIGLLLLDNVKLATLPTFDALLQTASVGGASLGVIFLAIVEVAVGVLSLFKCVIGIAFCRALGLNLIFLFQV